MIKKPEKNDSRRVVITGLGVVSSLGIGWQDFWKNLLAGKSGISKIESFDTSEYDRHYGGEVKNFDPSKFISKRKLSRMGRSSQMAIAASKLALKDAGINLNSMSGEDFGVCLGTTMGEAQIIEQAVDDIVNSKNIDSQNISALTYPANAILVNLANEFKLKNNCFLFATACSAGNFSIGYAFDLIKSGSANRMIAGGADSLSRIAFTGFSRLFSMALKKCQPFDKDRKGMMLGEGAGILVLESLENAQKRGAQIYAEVLGYGVSCDAFHMTRPSSDGISKAIKKALLNADITTDDVDYISAHGTGTKENDKTEFSAIQQVFASRAQKIPVNSIKSMLGHTMGAASALEAISCCLSIKSGEIPPTINLEERDPDIDIDCVPNCSKSVDVRIALNNAEAFGGNNACVVLGKGLKRNE